VVQCRKKAQGKAAADGIDKIISNTRVERDRAASCAVVLLLAEW
jgi:hypothetical protein